MKKFLSILCLGLICIFGFAGCSAEKNVTKFLDSVAVFSASQEKYLDITKTGAIFSSGLEEDYNSESNKDANQELDLRTLERLIQTSNLTVTKLKIYMENKDVVKKLKDSDVKELIKLCDSYQNDFSALISYTDSLEKVIAHGGGAHNIKLDYDRLNHKIKNVLVSSSKYSKKLTDLLKEIYNINVKENQNALNVGDLEILTLESASNLVYFFSCIYIEETNLASFGLLSPNMHLDDVLEKLAKLESAKFNLNEQQFAEIKNEILTLQNLNNSLISKLDYFTEIIKDFSYESLKEQAKTNYPNTANIKDAVISFTSSDRIDIKSQASYNFIADLISTNIAPAIQNMLSICTFIEGL